MKKWKEAWKHFAARPAGKRFRERYEEQKGKNTDRPVWHRVLTMLAGAALLVIGGFFAIAPGPAGIFVIAGGVLLAKESRFAAGVLDWIDLRLQPPLRWLQRHWRRLSPRTRKVAVAVMACGSVASVVVSCVLLMR